MDRAGLLLLRAALFREVAAIDSDLATLEGVDVSDSYTSHALPPGVSRRTFRQLCRSGHVHGARREGKVWRCSRDAWTAARAKAPPPTATLAANDDEAIVRRALDAAGLRATKTARAAS